MDDSQRALRRAAAEAFSRSLDQLNVCFQLEGEATAAQPYEAQPAPTAAKPTAAKPTAAKPTKSYSAAPETIPLQALEDAAADIEQLFRYRQT